MEAAVKAVEAVDSCIGRAVEAMLESGGEVLITADHGNAETMLDPITKQPHTAHTTNLVPFVYIGRPATMEHSGALEDIWPRPCSN
jgi:2,3-bisphosphoglycerate-independent phosphoglycerate mutase